MAGRDSILRVSERLYRALLVVYPKEFRDAYGAQLEQTFADLCREKVERGGSAGLARLWVRTLFDLASTATVQRFHERRRTKDEEAEMNEHRLAGIGLILLAAPLLFVAASLLKYGLGIGFLFDLLDEALLSDPENLRVFNLDSPLVFLGGLGLALLLSAHAVLRLNVGREDGSIVGTVRLEARFWNIAVMAVSLLLLVTLVGYLFTENFVYRP
jgi:uncharacterized protein YjiS (DUF1127 family)